MSSPDLTVDILAAIAARIEESNKRKSIDLQELMKITKFTKQEIKMLYRGFKQVGGPYSQLQKEKKRKIPKILSGHRKGPRPFFNSQRFFTLIKTTATSTVFRGPGS